jgi:hypothetical protein
MSANYTISEILLQIKTTAKNPNDIIRGLQQNNTVAFHEVLRYAFDGLPWYRKELPAFTSDSSPEGLAPTSLWAEIKRFYIFKTAYNLPVKRKDQILTQILESISKTEIELIRSMFDGSFKYTYGIDRETVEKAFPKLLGSQVVGR